MAYALTAEQDDGLKKRLISITLLAPLIASPGAACGPWDRAGANNSFIQLTATTIGTFPGGLNDLCDLDDASLSPSGKFVLFSSSRFREGTLVPASRELIVADASCLAKSGFSDQCMMKIQGLDGARPLSWSDDDAHLYVIENLDNIVGLKMRPGESPLGIYEDRLPLGFSFGKIVTAVGATPATRTRSEWLRIAANLRDQHSTYSPNATQIKSVSGRDFKAAISFDNHSLASRLAIDAGSTSLAVPRPFMEIGEVARKPSGRLTFSDTGLQYELLGRKWKSVNVPAFSRPLISPGSGNLLGTYDLKEARLGLAPKIARAAAEKINARIRSNPSQVLWRLSIDEQGRYAAVLNDPLGIKEFRTEVGGREASFSCARGAPYASIKTQIQLLGSHGRPVALVEEVPVNPLGVVAYFQGGPTSNLADAIDDEFAQFYLKRGWAVLLVGYSGSTGFGLASSLRLSRGGPVEFKRDAEVLKAYLDRSYPTARVIVHGESFGAAPAIALDAMLRDRVGGLVTLVPYLQSHPPSSWIETEGPLKGNVDYQTRFESVSIGIDGEISRTKFNVNLRSIFTGRSRTRQAFFAFSTMDGTSLAADIPNGYKMNSKIEYYKVPHRFIKADPALTDSISAWIASLSKQ